MTETGKELIGHLGLKDGEKYLFTGTSLTSMLPCLLFVVKHIIPYDHHLSLTNIIRTVDPENALYDDLDLNRGVKETFFSPSTPFAFLDRFTKKDGMKELGEVLSKWNKGELCHFHCSLLSFSLAYDYLCI